MTDDPLPPFSPKPPPANGGTPVPPAQAGSPHHNAAPASGPNPRPEPAPIRGIFGVIDALLREPVRVMAQLNRPNAGGLVLSMLGAALFCFLIYGVVAGTFSGGKQLWAAPVKIAGGLLVAGYICMPSLYIFACLGGVRIGIMEVMGLVAGMLAIMAVLLIGFAPVAWVFSQSTESLAAMGALHIAFGLVAFFFGIRFVGSAFIFFNAESRTGLNFWTLVFLLVSLQMTTALRPIIGKSDDFFPKEKKFFLTHWSEIFNAAVKSDGTPAKTER